MDLELVFSARSDPKPSLSSVSGELNPPFPGGNNDSPTNTQLWESPTDQNEPKGPQTLLAILVPDYPLAIAIKFNVIETKMIKCKEVDIEM